LFSTIRTFYNAYLLVREYKYKEMNDKIHGRQAEVIRRDEYYASDEENMDEIGGTERV
jgi:hypothetical protein